MTTTAIYQHFQEYLQSPLVVGWTLEQHVAMIKTLVNSLAGQINENENERPPIVVKCMAPNPEYATMNDEMEAYKALST